MAESRRTVYVGLVDKLLRQLQSKGMREAIRDLSRGREDAMRDLKATKHRLKAFLLPGKTFATKVGPAGR
jgi:hypothetical protein